MAYDEFFFAEQAYYFGRFTSAFTRWKNAANKAYSGTYTIDDLFEDARAQFVENWDTWNAAAGLPLRRQPPTLSVEGVWNTLTNETDRAFVYPRLTGITVERTKLWLLSDPTVFFATTEYEAKVVGNFDGEVLVTLKANAPQKPAAGERDVYQGFLTAVFPGTGKRRTICSVVVVATP